MIHVIATIRVVPEKRDQFLEEFRRLVPDVLAEEGCLEYGPAVDVATGIAGQAALRPDVVTVIEKWTGVAELEAHLRAPHMDAYRERVKDIVTGVEIQIYLPA